VHGRSLNHIGFLFLLYGDNYYAGRCFRASPLSFLKNKWIFGLEYDKIYFPLHKECLLFMEKISPFMSIFSKLFGGDPAQNFYKKHQLLLQEINDLEPEIQKLSDISLREKSLDLKTKISNNEDIKQALEDNLTTAFA
jgi:hypothetical protein